MRKFEREVEMIMNPPLDIAGNVEIINIFQEFVRTIKIKNYAYFCLIAVIHLRKFSMVIIFLSTQGTGMSLGRPIQGII